MVIKGKSKRGGMSAARQNSNVFAMFDQKQIAELKEAFSFIDSNNDGLIDNEDLTEIWASLGQEVSEGLLEEMLGATGPLNFTLFLTLMGERVQSAALQSEEDLLSAFQLFDEEQRGVLAVGKLKDVLTTGGDGEERLTAEEFEVLMRDAKVDGHGMVDYRELGLGAFGSGSMISEEHGALVESLVAHLHSGQLKLKDVSAEIKMQTSLDADAQEELAVMVRRGFTKVPSQVPLNGFPYGLSAGACCENMVGYVGIPLGMAGPLLVDGHRHWIPLATTEGALVASTSRGCKAIEESGGEGVRTLLLSKGMTRGPFLQLPSLTRAAETRAWIEAHRQEIQVAFEAGSSHLKLLSLSCTLAGSFLFLRFRADTGEAMGMNMVSRGTQAALDLILKEACPDALMACLSGNYCTDKKAGAALNWSQGRGYSVTAEAFIKPAALRKVLKIESVEQLVALAQAKNFVGSAMAGVAPGGQNAHAANLVAACFLACGQDPAQVVESAACLTHCQAEADGSLRISVTMPCIEVGVIGGGTRLPAQAALISSLTHTVFPEGKRAEGLARIIAATVLAGELSLLAALSTGSLVAAHLALNRKQNDGASTLDV